MSVKKIFQKGFLNAVCDFEMIQKKDKILIAFSGGKDSFAMLDFFTKLKKHKEFDFEIVGAYIVPKVPGINIFKEEIKKIFESYKIEYFIQEMSLSEDLETLLRDSKTCQWCSYSRRICLFKLAEKINATKIAYGHTMNDLVETFLLNVSRKKLNMMLPINKMRKGNFSIIRPLVYLQEDLIIEYGKQNSLIPLNGNCQIGKNSQREKVRSMIRKICEDDKKFLENMFSAYLDKFGKSFGDIYEE